MTAAEDVKGEDIKFLKEKYLAQVESHTPEEVKTDSFFDLDDPKEQKISLTPELIKKWNLESWLEGYRKEAMVSTGGIRGAQNILYPWDSRFPLNRIGVALATLGKARVLKADIKGRDIHKFCSGEVRYNTDQYIALIERLQAAQGIKTHLPKGREKTSIWMASFLIFMLDMDGGEYITSSHGISSKIATKDLDNQGSQFIPEMSARFVAEIEGIMKQAKEGGYDILLAKAGSENTLDDIDGYDLYVEYLKLGVATQKSIDLIKTAAGDGLRIMVECVGGCMYPILKEISSRLGIETCYEWHNAEEDPFFHGIGKVFLNPVTKNKEFYDYGCDTTIPQVVETLGYEKLLKDKKPGYITLMLDPDGDRLVVGQVEPMSRKAKIEELGIPYLTLSDEKIFCYLTPNQAFLLTMEFHAAQLKGAGLWDDHPRFIITTTPSAASWVEWAQAVGAKVIYVPVGFKEIANIMKKVEKAMEEDPDGEVIVTDIFGTKVDLGVQPRLLFAGEESGGMITGPEKLIESKKGRKAIAMREKSAGEASFIMTALAARLFQEKKLLSEYLDEVFASYGIDWRYDIRKETRFYNESEPDPVLLKREKAKGEILRDRIDNFFLAIALAKKEGLITLDDARSILDEALPDLDFSNLESIYFVGDGTYFSFSDKYVEIRKSGTDAIIKSYSAGTDKKMCERYAEAIAGYDGKMTHLFKKLIPEAFYTACQDRARAILREFQK